MARTSDDSRFRARPLRRLPAPVQFIAVAAGVHVAAWSVLPLRHRSWQDAATAGAPEGPATFPGIRLVSRRQGGPEAQRAAQKAIRRRHIPEGVDPSLLRRGLEGTRFARQLGRVDRLLAELNRREGRA